MMHDADTRRPSESRKGRRRRLLPSCALLILWALAGGSSVLGQSAEKPVVRKRPTASQAKAGRRAQRRQDRTVAMLRLLTIRVEKVEFDEQPLSETFGWFKDQGLKNLLVSWKVLERNGEITKETPVTLSLQDVQLGEVLDMVLSLVSDETQSDQERLTYHVFGGMLKISTRADFDRHTYTRTYYVEDLLYPISLNELMPYLQVGQQFAYVATLDPAVASGAVAQRPIIDVINTGTHHGPGGPEFGQPDFQGVREDQLDELVALLKTVRPQTWDDQGGRGTITAFSDKLIISQTIEMHEIIGGAFGRARTQRNKNKAGR